MVCNVSKSLTECWFYKFLVNFFSNPISDYVNHLYAYLFVQILFHRFGMLILVVWIFFPSFIDSLVSMDSWFFHHIIDTQNAQKTVILLYPLLIISFSITKSDRCSALVSDKRSRSAARYNSIQFAIRWHTPQRRSITKRKSKYILPIPYYYTKSKSRCLSLRSHLASRLQIKQKLITITWLI